MVYSEEFKRKKILLVEDSKSNRELFSIILDDIGYDIDTAENGAVAVEAYEKKNYDMILMDCEMPVLDGFEATKLIRIKENEETNKRIPIIALSARSLEDDKQLCLDAGMDDYIRKPVSLMKFSRILGGWLDKMDSEAISNV